MDFDLVILIVVVVLNSFLCLTVFLGGKGKINSIFSGFILFVILWSVVNYLAEILTNELVVRYLLGLTYAAALIIVTLFLRFVSIFPEDANRKLSLYEKIFYPTSFLFVILSFTSLIVQNVYIVEPRNFISTGPAIVGYMLFFILLVLVAFLILFKKFAKLKGVERLQVLFVILGTILTVVGAVVTNLIIPFITDAWDASRYGPYFSLFLIIFSAYAILKHRLFSVKIITTELLTFAIWIFILVQTLLAESLQERLVDGTLLALVVVFGIFLIKSVVREVEQREKIETLATDLQKANDRLTELDRQKSEFVSFATHQLRAPLTAMKGYASLILEGDMGKITDQTKEAVGRIFESTNTLTNIVDDYLNVTRIELGTMKYAFETIDLKTMIEDVIAELKPNIDKATKVKFLFGAENAGMDYRITADKDKLKQVVANLIDNSLKYTPSGSVGVSLSFNRAKHKFVFMLKDTGIGIAPETLPHLFNKFTRAGNANRTNIKGTGLGLFVAKEIIAAHHGTIRAESEGEGKGATFIVELEPFAKA